MHAKLNFITVPAPSHLARAKNKAHSSWSYSQTVCVHSTTVYTVFISKIHLVMAGPDRSIAKHESGIYGYVAL